ncbi:adaptin N terminal region-domain-containing protein [Limtongia smithiae]|uniref:adaptin N terminal region-domain-containing protein n=1 Tax=Limtongia smithiae TaxID=1125753 RepID=UPI0034CD8BBC
MSSLKEFIKTVRSAKTMADERAVIQKESAALRSSFHEDITDPALRRQNIAKLLYLFTLGERTHFGQIECVKLLATSKFSDKRLGYLGAMLLLDEKQEVLTLVTNSLKNDLNSSNPYVVALALCTLGNIASEGMARDLFADIEKLIVTQNPYLRKKAALCAMRIVNKVPDLRDRFVDKAKLLLGERNHGVLLCGITLIIDLCKQDPTVVAQFRQFVPALLRQLMSLSTSGYTPEHDVTGISDPFLQVKILQLLRVLGKGDRASAEQMNDILTKVASDTDGSKNVGNAILYEAVLTILDIDADSSLRVLGITILGRFLGNKDNNAKYVGLNTLSRVIEIEPNAVQRHRNTILECLHDPDVSIRRRALELSFELINDQNIRVLVRELLVFLETADTEFKTNMTLQICIAADKFAPNKRWHIDTILRVFKLAGNYVSEQIISQFIALVTNTPAMQLYTVQKLYSLLKTDITQEALTVAGTWITGEYADELLKAGTFKEEEVTHEVSQAEIVQIFESILHSTYATQMVQEYVLDALVKLSTRLTDPSQIDRVRRLIGDQTAALDVEIQQRAVEYTALFGFDDIRKGVLEKMPPAELREKLVPEKKTSSATPTPAAVAKPKSESDILLDLMGGEDLTAPPPAPAANGDLLSQAMGASGGFALPTTTAPTNGVNGGAANSTINDILGLYGSGSSAASVMPVASMAAPMSTPAAPIPIAATAVPVTATPATAIPAYEAYNNNGLIVSMQAMRDPNAEAVANVLVTFANAGADPISEVLLQVAVPKTQTMELLPISNNALVPGARATQKLRVAAARGALLRLRLRISYIKGGQTFVDMSVFNKFPENLLA